MGDRVGLFLYILAGISLFGMIGALFGGLAGHWYGRRGRAAGALVGPAVMRALERVGRRPWTPLGRSVFGGAVEGGVFLAVIGGAVGGWAHESGYGLVWLLVVSGLVALLAAAAVLFGVLGYALVGLGVRASGAVLLGAMAGAAAGAFWGGEAAAALAGLLGVRLSGSDPTFAALIGGAVLGGILGGCVTLLRRPVPQSPRDDDPEPAPDGD